MSNIFLDTYHAVERTCRFLKRTVCGFLSNQGLLLAGAVAYYTLLSIVPLTIIALIVLTHFIEERQLIQTLSTYLEMLIPGYATTLTEQVLDFMEHREAVGFIVILGMLFFSSMAFSMLERAMSVIFFHSANFKQRNFLVSALIPYLYIIAMGLGIALVSLITGAMETLESSNLTIMGRSLDLGGTTMVALYLFGIAGEILMFTSIYLVMPVMSIKFSHALVGGITATVLWEITRRALVWYYAAVSMVNVIYGSIAIAVAALLSIEVVAIILLLGAQVIAELEHKRTYIEKRHPDRIFHE